MTVDLNQSDLLSMIMGQTLSPQLFNEFEDYGYGHVSVNDNKEEQWMWHHYTLENLSEEELWGIYRLIKEEGGKAEVNFKIPVSLDKEDIIRILGSIAVPYDNFEELKRKRYGNISSNMGSDQFIWNETELKNLPIWKLWSMYTSFKNYWKAKNT